MDVSTLLGNHSCRMKIAGALVALAWIASVAGPATALTGVKLPAGSGGLAHDEFGGHVAISGDFAIVGAGAETGLTYYDGKVYFYRRSGASWTEQAMFPVAADPYQPLVFGQAVAISGSYAIAGAPAYNDMAKSRAYVYGYDGQKWSQQQVVEPSANFGQTFDNRFGQAVSISGDLVIVGARNRAYVFRRTGSGWNEEATLTAGGDPPREFGTSVSISGSYAIVGGDDGLAPTSSPAVAYVFFYDGNGWGLQAKLVAGPGLKDGTRQAVAINGDYALVGQTTANFSNVYEGKAALYQRSGTQWQKLSDLPFAPPPNTRFGWSVALGPHYAVIGDPWDSQGGAVYVAKHDGTFLFKIAGVNGASADQFGQAVATDGYRIVVGAPGETGPAGVYQGAAYAYEYVPWSPARFRQILERYLACPNCPPVPCLTCPPFELRPEQWEELAPLEKEFLIGLTLQRMARSTDPKFGRELERIGREMVKKVLDQVEQPQATAPAKPAR